MWRDVYELCAFTKNGKGGNPAGVVLKADGLTAEEMKEIAYKVGFSETAFVLPSSEADYHIRYFTPNEEVDVCGHATIATFSLLTQLKQIQNGIYTIETKAGILKVTVNEDESVYLEQNRPIFGEVLPRDEIIQSLGLKETDLLSELPIQIVSTGLPDIIIPVRSLSVLEQLNPDFTLISGISKKSDVIGYHVFTLETMFGSSAHCRNFAPLYEINEESATGTANAALACYLTKYKKTTDPTKTYTFEQGYSMNCPSEIIVHIGMISEVINKVHVGGFSSDFTVRRIKNAI